MERTRKTLLFLLAAFLAGCVPVMSLHPLYTEKDLVFDDKLLGTWAADSNNILEFSKSDKSAKAYQVIYSVTKKDGKGRGIFDVHLVKLEGKLFLDVYPAESPCGDIDDPNNKPEWLYNLFFTLPVHTFVRVDSIEPQLKLRLSDDETMKKLLKKDPSAVGHEMIEDNTVLTAKTEELQKFVVKYADSNEFFSEEIMLNRVTGKKTE